MTLTKKARAHRAALMKSISLGARASRPDCHTLDLSPVIVELELLRRNPISRPVPPRRVTSRSSTHTSVPTPPLGGEHSVAA